MSLDSRDPRLLPAAILAAILAIGGASKVAEYISDSFHEHAACQANPECAAKIEEERKEIQAIFARWVPYTGR